jgi:hypothetical protein
MLSILGWGSLSLYLGQVHSLHLLVRQLTEPILQKYPKSRVIGLSNSSTQKAYIDSAAKARGLTNVKVLFFIPAFA